MSPSPLTRFESVAGPFRRTGGGLLFHCPTHEDRRASLSVRELADGRLLVHCHAGCPTADILGALGLRFADLFAGGLR